MARPVRYGVNPHDIPEDDSVLLPGEATSADRAARRRRLEWDRAVAADLDARNAERRAMDELAERGKWLADRADDESTARPLAESVSAFLSEVLPHRAADRARGELVLRLLRESGHVVAYRHGAARVEPDPPPDLAPLVDELQPYLCDLLEEEGHDA